MPMRPRHKFEGFTFVELLVALIVASIIFAAVATLAYTLGAVNDATNDMAEKQAQVRFATLRISELIRHCKLVCGTPGDDLVVWRADTDGDSQIDPNELVYIEAGSERNYVKLLDFPDAPPATEVLLSDIKNGNAKTNLLSSYNERRVSLIPECSNVQYVPDSTPPQSKLVSVFFGLDENGVTRQYQISAALRGWAGNLLNAAGDAVVSDDD
jgi:prepilin-type N-terminal cleavage/methylation domain-containing protein